MSYPPPSRRSRSRSPRGSYQPRNVYDYPPEPWENYDKDRYPYEKDRSYDYARRGRSRSPDDYSRKRRRSPSPYDRDRYEPRPRYNDDFDTHSRSYGHSPPRRGHGPQFSSRRPPPDPHTLDYPANLRQYAEWFRYYFPHQATDEDNADKAAEQEAGDGSKPRNGIRSRWEKYKKDFSANQLQTMFEHHKKSPWFWEKYNPAPEFQKLRQKTRKGGWKSRLNNFLLDLDLGKYDPDLNETQIEKKDIAAEIPADGAAEDSKPVDDDMQFNIDAEDDAGADANGKTGGDYRRSNKGEEIAVAPEGNQVMIRTIPPDIGRIKLEESCRIIPGYVYLALGDPLQKRNYYRAGWLRFTDDADMTLVMSELQDRKIEGFKLHVSHTTKPFINKIRIAPDVASRPERMEKDLTNAKVLAGLLEEEAATLRKMKSKDFAPPKPEEEALMEEKNLDNVVVDVDVDGEEEEEEEPPERGSDAVDRRIEKVMADMRDQGLVDMNDEDAYEVKRTEVSLDLYLAYLRAAYHACYYCSVVTDHLEELQRKCLKHVRKPLPKPSVIDEVKMATVTEGGQDDEKPILEKEATKKDSRGRNDRGDDRWLDWLDQKIALLINRNEVDPRDYGGKSYDEELSKLVEPHIKQEDEGKFRCRTCQKLFKATSFVEKHIANKHPELVKSLDDIPYFNNFALDPHRIQPFAHPPAAVGNNSQAPPQAYGIQSNNITNNFGEYGRMPYPYPPGYPPPGNGYWGDYGPPGKGFYDGYPPPPSQRRDESVNGRPRLSERLGVFADIPANAGLPPKPPAALDTALSAGNMTNNPRRRNGGGQTLGGPPPPPPPDAKEDPRAAAGRRVSYHDMDLVAEGDVELTY
ncbi:hypothetical protein BDP27DRAFT_1313687 [Rhodocollybia butyracea]|uniref:C2H2-type domain-containing protein n=1 Tax=Rhodocollybia butyracea TaxID=206335 RepID=A0A9P5UFT3_9AGAR|nr:hypothetical protein BDP27DRAFT_1313687 [Rhodocollybia butyracea]